jgi:hypothetical protein
MALRADSSPTPNVVTSALHHTLGNGDFNVFTKMSEGISCYVARLNEPHDAATGRLRIQHSRIALSIRVAASWGSFRRAT